MAQRTIKIPKKTGSITLAQASKTVRSLEGGAGISKRRAKRKLSTRFMKAMTPSPSLAAVIGSTPLPRTEVTKKLWAYIKKNDLRDSKNRRNINADDILKDVFGGKKRVSTLDVPKLISGH